MPAAESMWARLATPMVMLFDLGLPLGRGANWIECAPPAKAGWSAVAVAVEPGPDNPDGRAAAESSVSLASPSAQRSTELERDMVSALGGEP